MSVQLRERLYIGIGSISPAERVAAGEIRDEVIDELRTELETDRFYDELPSGIFIPKICVDGRGFDEGPNAAGGTLTVVVADALTTGAYRKPDNKKFPEHTEVLCGELAENYEIGGHGDDQHVHAHDCGCGAADKAGLILKFIEESGGHVQDFLSRYGIEVTSKQTADLQSAARLRRLEGYVTNGSEVQDALIKVGGKSAVPILRGPHKEVVLSVNLREGTSINRKAVAQVYGPEYQVFCADLWAIEASAKEISITAHEAQEKFLAALFYNVATAAVLADSSLRIAVHQ